MVQVVISQKDLSSNQIWLNILVIIITTLATSQNWKKETLLLRKMLKK
jgi:hypothetical protein